MIAATRFVYYAVLVIIKWSNLSHILSLADLAHLVKLKHETLDLDFIVTVFLWLQKRLSVPLSSALSVCPAIKAYISVTMGWILMKLGESVGT